MRYRPPGLYAAMSHSDPEDTGGTVMLPLDVRPVCADPVWLPLIDAAFAVGGASSAHEFLKKACSQCPVSEACLGEAMVGSEHGPWGGTTARVRTAHGARPPGSCGNLEQTHAPKMPPVDELQAIRASGTSVADMAAAYGCSTVTIYKRLRKAS